MWLKVHDGLPFDPKVLLLGRTKAEINEAIGMAARLWAWCAQQRTDGFLLTSTIDAVGTPAALKRLCRPVFDRRPFLHRRGIGDDCECLRGRAWPDGADYLVHDWLAYNPSRQENDVARAKNRELRDKALKMAVRTRDHDHCRYCGQGVNFYDHRSAAGGTLDHVDPGFAGGAANLVVACRACNSRKKDRRPEEVGMRLLPLPGHPAHPGSDDQTHDRPTIEPTVDPRLNPSSTREKPTDTSTGLSTGPDVGRPPPEPAPTSPDAGSARPHAAVLAPDEATPDHTHGGLASGSGRDGTGNGYGGGSAGYAGPSGVRPTVGPPNTPRGQLDRNPYLKHWPDNDHHAGHPSPEDQP